MIKLPDARAQAEVEAALRSENPAAQTTWEFSAGLLDLKNRAESLSYAPEGDSLAVGLESEVSGPLDPSMRGQDVTVDLVVAGHPIRRFTGRVHRPQNQGFRSTLRANTAGWWATGESAVKMGRERRFSGYTPKRAAEETLFSLPYAGPVDVEETAQQEFLREASEPFEATEEAGAVLSAVAEETGMVFRDTRLNGCRGRVPRPAPLAGDAVWTFRVGRDLSTEGLSYSAEPKEFRDVLAWRQRADGSTEELARAEIPGSSAPRNATYLIPVETEGNAAYAEGRQKVNDAVTNLVHGQSAGTLELPFIHALLEEGDAVEVEEASEDPGGLLLRRWLCRVDLISEDPFSMTQTLEWTGTHREERLPEEAPAPPRGSGGVVRMGA